MSKKKIVIITRFAKTANFLFKEIKSIFTDNIEIEKYCFELKQVKKGIAADLILIPDLLNFELVKNFARDGVEITVLRRTLTKKGLDKLLEINSDSHAMLVNATANTALDTISTIQQLGVRHIKLTPVYPGLDNLPELDLAITPGESKYIPGYVKEVIDIGNRVLDISTIIDILVKFNLSHLLDTKEVQQYFQKIVPVSLGMEKVIGKNNNLESQLDIFLKLLDVGVIGINSAGIVDSYNNSAEKIIGLAKDKVLGADAEKLFPEIPFADVLRSNCSVEEKLVKMMGWDIALTVKPILKGNSIYGAVAIIRKFSDAENEQHKLRAQLINKGHVAKYQFNDIIGNSTLINKCKNIAKRMARSKSTILIMGESGTGKELFAQAIHNYSDRRAYQFVAVNCAALPESLLESELFGYEKGAFTGARKNGKLGLFELAHNGSLFLDEIGEMPLGLQTRLLRVLEEKEVMRIGGERVINVDARIIAASNRNLKELVLQGKFRKDLFYRLNILPLVIPPLRKRKADIGPLIARFKEELGANFTLTDAALRQLARHNWDGNVRELRNYLEYFASLNQEVIAPEDFPFGIENMTGSCMVTAKETAFVEELKNSFTGQFKDYLFILAELENRYRNNKRSGRASLAQAAERESRFLTEQEIRKICTDLKKHKLVTVTRGRGGTKITDLGIKLLNHFNG